MLPLLPTVTVRCVLQCDCALDTAEEDREEVPRIEHDLLRLQELSSKAVQVQHAAGSHGAAAPAAAATKGCNAAVFTQLHQGLRKEPDAVSGRGANADAKCQICAAVSGGGAVSSSAQQQLPFSACAAGDGCVVVSIAVWW